MHRKESSLFFRRFRLQSGLSQLFIATNNKQPPWRALAAIGGFVFLALCIGCGAAPEAVSSTSNPQVALYVYNARSSGYVTVEFGKTTAYGFETSPQQVPAGGAPMRIFVAGMLGDTTYHMRAVAKYSDGTTDTDKDQTFTTGSYPSAALPQITAAASTGQTPQAGIEIINAVETTAAPVIATNLSGQVIWAYLPSSPIPAPALVQAPKMMANGNFVFVVAPSSSTVLNVPSTIPAGTINSIREINLLGATINELTIAELNQKLSAANYNLTLLTFHHDVTVLPNGHLLVLTNTVKSVTLTGQTAPTQVLGDVVIDLDTNLNPVWVWNEFDHLDVNRHPWKFPDWTHSNAIVYSKDDGNFLVSMRHQNWVVKVDYNNGAGTGNVIWRLGEGGDFTLQGGIDPTDWFYAQHGPSFTTANTTGIFGLTVMDNGDDRMYPGGPAGVTCGIYGAAACYSTIPIFQINETTKTAALTFHQILPANLYNFFGGNSQTLDNGNVEYDLCGLNGTPDNSQVSEVTATPDNPQQVWTLTMSTAYGYRANRVPSLYPGVQW